MGSVTRPVADIMCLSGVNRFQLGFFSLGSYEACCILIISYLLIFHSYLIFLIICHYCHMLSESHYISDPSTLACEHPLVFIHK